MLIFLCSFISCALIIIWKSSLWKVLFARNPFFFSLLFLAVRPSRCPSVSLPVCHGGEAEDRQGGASQGALRRPERAQRILSCQGRFHQGKEGAKQVPPPALSLRLRPVTDDLITPGDSRSRLFFRCPRTTKKRGND